MTKKQQQKKEKLRVNFYNLLDKLSELKSNSFIEFTSKNIIFTIYFRSSPVKEIAFIFESTTGTTDYLRTSIYKININNRQYKRIYSNMCFLSDGAENATIELQNRIINII